MKASLLLLLVAMIAPSMYSAEWFELLPPGITRSEILQIAGKPSSSREEMKFQYPPEGKTNYLALSEQIIPDDLHVFPYFALFVRVAQKVGRMEGRHQLYSPVVDQLSAKTPDRLRCLQ